MVNAIPKWVWNRYALLWKKFKDKQFTYQEAEKVLKYDELVVEIKNAIKKVKKNIRIILKMLMIKTHIDYIKKDSTLKRKLKNYKD